MTGWDLVQRGGLIRIGIPVGVIFVCAALLGWSAADTPVPPAPRVAAGSWSLPQVEARDPARDLAIITAGRPWDRGIGSPDTGSAAAAAAGWRLAGIVERNDQRFALIASGPDTAAKLDYLSLGDSLPDGSVLVELTPDSAAVEGGKSAAAGRRVYRLFDKKK
jgi:hypothetical protein